VTDNANTIAELGDKGVQSEFYEFMVQDQSGIWTTPDGIAIAWCKDQTVTWFLLRSMMRLEILARSID